MPSTRIARLTKQQHLPDSRLALRVMRVPLHGQMDQQHSHDFEELVVILGGRGTHHVGRESYEIGVGDVFVLLGETSHAYSDVNRLSLINILYDSARLRLPRADLGEMSGYHALFEVEPRLRQRQRFKNRLKLPMEDLARLATMVAEMEQEIERRAPGHRFIAASQFMRIIGFLSRCYSRLPADEPRPVNQVSDILSYMEQNYAKPLTIGQLADVAAMSQTSLFRVFRQVMGRSPIDYLIRLRMAKAASLLRRDHVRVGEAGRAVGFTDSNYFTRQFRAVMGVCPRAYRRRGPQ